MTVPPDQPAPDTFGWRFTGTERPSFAEEPGPGQESVWDYPRPPVVLPDDRTVLVGADADPLARSSSAVRVLETASPPTWYLPVDDVELHRLVPHRSTSFCEWKGAADYWALADDPDTPVAWGYRRPSAGFETLGDRLAFYPSRIPCQVDGEQVRAQAGGFYGGWITSEVVGPFKGDPRTRGW